MFAHCGFCNAQRVSSTDSEELLIDLGRRIAELRAGSGLTQEQLAERLDLTPRYVQMIEAGEANPKVKSLVGIAAILGVEVRELFDEPESRQVRVGRPPKER